MYEIYLFQKRVGDPMHKRWEDCVVPSGVQTIRGLQQELLDHNVVGYFRVLAETPEGVSFVEFEVQEFTDTRVVPSEPDESGVDAA